ncbi:MAG: MoxR family ATPase [Gammaproteobacteria bacterium]|nr:MoxR family ATPase [Gammaproteobacteria bacterium]
MDTATSTREAIYRLRDFVSQHILGQERLVERLLVALLCDGHLLVEGAPGLAKTRAIKVLGEGIEGEFHRIQFTPDLMPADLTGTEIYRPQDGSFVFQQGPLFHNLVLADEVNRAPAKVQSALLEAMGERQITIGRVSYQLPELFMVMATQNPLEHEGTYPLPEAQLDRFLLHVNITYPDHEAEKRVLHLAREEAANPVEAGAAPTAVIDQEQVFAARREVLATFMSEDVERYLMEIVFATRSPAPYGDDLASWLEYGGSPRATIALDRTARAHAWLAGQDYVSPADVQDVASDVLRHRVILNYEATADGVTTDRFVNELVQRIAVP